MGFKHAVSVACGVSLVFGCLSVCAADTYPLVDSNTSAGWTFTNSLGTASTTNGTMVVFEGQLDASMNITSAWSNVAGAYLATVQLLVEVKLFDELPSSNEVADVQGAVAALKNGAGKPGLYFAWGVSNSVATWVPLMNTNGTQFSVYEGATNYVTFVFNYSAAPVSYQVFIGNYGDEWMRPSEPITSVSSKTDGIDSVSLLGAGVLQSVGSASGAPADLSSKLSMRVYFASNSVCADVYTVNEKGTSPIKIYAWINGDWVLVGTIDDVKGEFSNTYHVILSGLTPGQTYKFKVYDEVGHEYVESLVVESIAIGSAVVDLAMQTLNVTFSSVPDATYEVRVSGELGGTSWTAEEVSVNQGGSWGSPTNTFKAEATQTQIRIPKNRDRAFFRIYRLD